jgi:hypothetical protein
VLGYRAARRWTRPFDLWALDILAEEGYAYDSSLVPISRSFRREPWRRFAHQHKTEGKSIWEFPVSTCNLLGWGMPIAGGNYSRQFPHTLLKHLVERWHKSCDAPFVMYTHCGSSTRSSHASAELRRSTKSVITAIWIRWRGSWRIISRNIGSSESQITWG